MQCHLGLLFPWQFQFVIRGFKIYFLFKKFLTRYFDHIFSRSPTLPNLSTHPISCPSFSFSKTKSKQTTKKYQNKTNRIQKHGVCFKLTNYSWAWSLPWGYDLGIPIGGSWFSLSKQELIVNFLVMVGTWCPLLLLSAGILSSLSLCNLVCAVTKFTLNMTQKT